MSKAAAIRWVLLLAVLAAGCSERSVDAPETFEQSPRQAEVFPDYDGCVVPPNIAPLNMVVNEPGAEVLARLTGPGGKHLTVRARSGKVIWPEGPWRDLLTASKGQPMSIEVFVRDQADQWTRFEPITFDIAEEPIDPYLVYRLVGPVHNLHREMGIYQRCIETFDETPIMVSDRANGTCVNCHSFANNRPETMSLHLRGSSGLAMLLARDGSIEKLDTRTARNKSPAAYMSWHPSGRVLAFSVNRPELWQRTTGPTRVVVDRNSDMAVYDLDTGAIRSTRHLADPNALETFPSWSPDGKHLYFCRAIRTWEIGSGGAHRHYQPTDTVPPGYEQLRYDLVRVGFDIETGEWTPMETVLSAEAFGKTICEPRVSPDGRFCLFTAAAYGTFPIYHEDADLFMLDLTDGRTWPIEANSDRTESWHAWSTNGRWIVFVSKRRDGLFARPYFSYVDSEGRTAKPVLLPQEDPAFYDSFLKTYNAPEFLTGPVTVTADQIGRAAQGEYTRRIDATSTATPMVGTESGH